MVKLLTWNVRGYNAPNKQKEVKFICNEEKIRLLGLLETKVKSNKIEELANKLFVGWNYVFNLTHHYNGRIWIA